MLAVPVGLFGIGWPINKIALAHASPLWFAAGRAVLSTLASIALVIALGQWRWPGKREIPIIASVGALQLAAFFALTNLGLSLLPAGRSVVLSSTTTLWLVPLAEVLDPTGHIEPNLPALGGLFYVGVLAGPLATWAAVIVARDLPSVVSSLGFLGIPALGLILSTTLLGEHLTWSLAGGSALIGLGVVLAVIRRREAAVPATPARL